ncbi:MAG TPA: Dabb family protein [Gemmatimonadales bacterium]|nr:Dabb family protein [Gemmatimonadales bacterium]
MIHHIVLFRFRDGVTPAQLDAARDALQGLAGRVPEVRRIAFGPNQAPGSEEWPWVLVVVVDDMAAVQRYLDHPAHQDAVKHAIVPIRAARLAVDVEVPA